MAKRGRHKKGGRVTPKGTRPPGTRSRRHDDPGDPFGPPGPPGGGEPDLADDIRDALRSGEPVALLSLASTLVAVADPRERNPFEPDRRPELPPLSDLVRSFIEVEGVETSALIAAIAPLITDEVLRQAVERELARRADRLPRWLVELGSAEFDGAVEMGHVLGDGENVMVGVRLAEGHALSIVAYVDHNLGTAVKDAFVVPEPLDELTALMRERATDPDTTWHDLDPADARARIEAAVERGAMTVPAFETDTWPMCRPIVEWVAQLLPEGGTGYERPEWSEADTQALADRFFASEFGGPLDDVDHRDLLNSLLWFGTDYGPGDPLRWSPSAVEIFLVDWVPRKVMADRAFLAPMPDLLRAFVRFAHAERDISALLTEDTLGAVDDFEADYLRAIGAAGSGGLGGLGAAGSGGPGGLGAAGSGGLGGPGGLDPVRLLGALGGLDSEEVDLEEIGAAIMSTFADRIGGAEVLHSLDDRPLPDEAFDWSGIAEDIAPRVAEVLRLCDDCCDTLLDTEYRTACRRLLARIARGGPEVFRRKGRADTAAAAICWTIGRENELFGGDEGIYAKDVVGHFGLTGSVSQRSGTLLRAAGLTNAAGAPSPASADLLVSTERRNLIDARDRFAEITSLLSELPSAPPGDAPLGSPLGAPSRPVPSRPASADRRPGPAGDATIHRLKVTLEGLRPPVWRRLEVASDTSLAALHDILQASFDWDGSHLHEFVIDGRRYGVDDPFGFEFGVDDPMAAEDAVTLAEVAPEGARFTYTYDFGDDWRHRIAVEAVEAPSPGTDYPTCVTGRMPAPPEDVGGPPGYEHLLVVLADPTHPDHEELSEWVDGPIDPAAFDAAEINRQLRALSPTRRPGRR